MLVLNLEIESFADPQKRRHPLQYEVKRIINSGFTGRDQDAVNRYIEQLRKENIETPRETPVFLPKIGRQITSSNLIEVIGTEHSGEAEFALIPTKDETYIAAGSDHTERELESVSLLKAKQICPNVVSKKIWALSEVKDIWDRFIMKSWIGKNRKILDQETSLSKLISPEELLSLVEEFTDVSPINTVIFSGTVEHQSGMIKGGDYYEVEILDPVTNNSLICAYELKEMAWFKGKLTKGF